MAKFFQWLLKRYSKEPLPEQILFLLTNPRSGSTWLFDSLRSHPAITFLPSHTIYKQFGFNGRRYPLDLSDKSDASVDVEVYAGRWSRIPDYAVQSTTVYQPVFAIEKIHPHFFGYEPEKFLSQVKALRAKTEFRMIYQVRHPYNTLTSFFEYQKRNPTWNRKRTPDSVPLHMRRTFESIYELAAAYPGLVIDYADLTGQYQATMEAIFRFIWPGMSQHDPELINAMWNQTRREKRKQINSHFLADQPTEAKDTVQNYEAFFEQHADEIKDCMVAYERLLAMKKPPIQGTKV